MTVPTSDCYRGWERRSSCMAVCTSTTWARKVLFLKKKKKGQMVTGKLLCHKGMLFNGFIGGER